LGRQNILGALEYGTYFWRTPRNFRYAPWIRQFGPPKYIGRSKIRHLFFATRPEISVTPLGSSNLGHQNKLGALESGTYFLVARPEISVAALAYGLFEMRVFWLCFRRDLLEHGPLPTKNGRHHGTVSSKCTSVGYVFDAILLNTVTCPLKILGITVRSLRNVHLLAMFSMRSC
jgi:hypothetical protein